MSYHKCPKCEGRETICASCGEARIPKRYQSAYGRSLRHEDHLSARIIKCPDHQQPWYNCDCCGKEHVEGKLYLSARNVFPRKLERTDSEAGIGYCGDCASFIRARLEVAFDEAIEKIEVVK